MFKKGAGEIEQKSRSIMFPGYRWINSKSHSTSVNHLDYLTIKERFVEQLPVSLSLPCSFPSHISGFENLPVFSPPSVNYMLSRNRKLYLPKSSSLGQSSISLRALASFCFMTSLRSSHSVSSSWPWAERHFSPSGQDFVFWNLQEDNTWLKRLQPFPSVLQYLTPEN